MILEIWYINVSLITVLSCGDVKILDNPFLELPWGWGQNLKWKGFDKKLPNVHYKLIRGRNFTSWCQNFTKTIFGATLRGSQNLEQKIFDENLWKVQYKLIWGRTFTRWCLNFMKTIYGATFWGGGGSKIWNKKVLNKRNQNSSIN